MSNLSSGSQCSPFRHSQHWMGKMALLSSEIPFVGNKRGPPKNHSRLNSAKKESTNRWKYKQHKIGLSLTRIDLYFAEVFKISPSKRVLYFKEYRELSKCGQQISLLLSVKNKVGLPSWRIMANKSCFFRARAMPSLGWLAKLSCNCCCKNPSISMAT